MAIASRLVLPARRLALGVGALMTALFMAGTASARPPADDFLEPQKPGPRLQLAPFIGPGFRAAYDHRIELESQMSELRVQALGTVALPFAQASLNVELRLFLMLFGASAGYHNEWRFVRFQPAADTGRDPAVQTASDEPPGGKSELFSDLTRAARIAKEQSKDTGVERWPFVEGRWGFVVPGYGFTGLSNLTLRYDGRPDVSYDWEMATVMNGGLGLRWEGLALFRARNLGFLGPALRVLAVPRNRTRGDLVTSSGTLLPDGSACQRGVVPGLACDEVREVEVHYGLAGGHRGNWISPHDTLLLRVYTTWGLGEDLFGNHLIRLPLHLQLAYLVEVEL